MKKLSISILLMYLVLSGCVTPKATVIIYPPVTKVDIKRAIKQKKMPLPIGTRQVEINTSRLGVVEIKTPDKWEIKFDSKGKSLMEDLVKIYTLKTINED